LIKQCSAKVIERSITRYLTLENTISK